MKVLKTDADFSDDQILCDLHDLPEVLAARCVLSFLAYDIWGSIITEM